MLCAGIVLSRGCVGVRVHDRRRVRRPQLLRQLQARRVHRASYDRIVSPAAADRSQLGKNGRKCLVWDLIEAATQGRPSPHLSPDGHHAEGSKTMNSRERILAALDHRLPDRVPIDFRGNRSLGTSREPGRAGCFSSRGSSTTLGPARRHRLARLRESDFSGRHPTPVDPGQSGSPVRLVSRRQSLPVLRVF